MTEQEAEMWATRLRWVWEPVGELEWEFAFHEPSSEERFDCFAEWAPGIWFEYFWWPRVDSFVCEISKKISYAYECHEYLIVGRLRCYVRSGQIESIFPVQLGDNQGFRSMYDQFCAHYLAPFRRGCWLSGCDIEATAHEKAEWMQRFRQEEVEGWDLKI